jgi:hypothetical protein
MVTDDSKAFRLDNVEFEVVGGATLTSYFQQFRWTLYLSLHFVDRASRYILVMKTNLI